MFELLLNTKSSQKHHVKTGVSQCSNILGPTFFLQCINDLLDVVISNVTICVDKTSIYSKCSKCILCTLSMIRFLING